MLSKCTATLAISAVHVGRIMECGTSIAVLLVAVYALPSAHAPLLKVYYQHCSASFCGFCLPIEWFLLAIEMVSACQFN